MGILNRMKIAYPNYDQYINFSPPRDTQKWIETVKNMFHHIHMGVDKTAAFNTVTAGWDKMEKLDFQNWLKFYEENTHKKYSSENLKSSSIKTAQVGYWEDINRAGYFVPLHQESTLLDTNKIDQQIDFAVNPETNTNTAENSKKEIIENQRSKILSRLDSAEKLLRSTDGHIMAGNELASLMRAIYDLKERIHVVNKKSASTRLYEDMIAREANVLVRKGFNEASKILYKIADGEPLAPIPPANPTSGGGIPGNLPGEAPGQVPLQNNTPDVKEEPLAEGMKEFLKGLETGNLTHEEDLEVNDSEDELTVEAQAVPPVPSPEIEVHETEVPEKIDKNFDSMIDQAFHNLTINDVVNRLEDLAKIFKTREVPRQLAIVDMMLDKLGLASFFPTLAEATNKALDSNQYISTRVEDILSKLRGTIETKEIDLKNENHIEPPEVAAIKQKLQESEEKDKVRKELRKKVEDDSLQQKTKEEAPEIEVEEDLGQPAQTTTQIPVAPPAPPVPTR